MVIELYLLEKDLKSGRVLETGLKPSKIVGIGLNYMSHVKEAGLEPPDEPVIFLKPPSSLIGNGDVIIIPDDIGSVHYEVELAVVIGWRARKVSAQEAMSYVYGYGVFIDVTARDLQMACMKKGTAWALSKGFDTFAPISPIVKRDYVEDPHNLELKLWVNGELKQHGNTSDMIFKIPELIEYISRAMTLEPGDIIATGTPSGVGPIKPGDQLKATLSNLVELTVRVCGE